MLATSISTEAGVKSAMVKRIVRLSGISKPSLLSLHWLLAPALRPGGDVLWGVLVKRKREGACGTMAFNAWPSNEVCPLEEEIGGENFTKV